MNKTINVQGTDVYLNGNGNQIIVMIHGWPDTHEIWHNQVDFFQKEFTCVTFTLPSFDKPDYIKYSVDDYVNRIKNIIDTVSPDNKIILLVHDWGCVFGYEYAMRFPEKIEKLIGLDIGDAASPDFQKSLTLQAQLMVFGYQSTLAMGYFTKNDFIHKTMAKALKARSNINNIHAGMGLPYAMRWFGVAGGINNLKPIEPTFPFFYGYAMNKPFQFHTKKWEDNISSNPANKVQAFRGSHWIMIDRADELNTSIYNWLKI